MHTLKTKYSTVISAQGDLDWALKPDFLGFQCHVMNLAGCTQFPAKIFF